MSVVFITQAQYDYLFGAAKKVHGMKGVGVINAPDGITITAPDAISPPVPAAADLFRVTVATDGGSAGDATTQCSFTYTVTSLGGVELATAKTPTKARPALGVMVVGDDIGWAYYDADGLQLWDANEVVSTEAC